MCILCWKIFLPVAIQLLSPDPRCLPSPVVGWKKPLLGLPLLIPLGFHYLFKLLLALSQLHLIINNNFPVCYPWTWYPPHKTGQQYLTKHHPADFACTFALCFSFNLDAFNATKDVFGPINIVCNNAGLGGSQHANQFRDWDGLKKLVDVNIVSTSWILQQIEDKSCTHPSMHPWSKVSGNIIILSLSVLTTLGFTAYVPLAFTKAATKKTFKWEILVPHQLSCRAWPWGGCGAR